MIDYFKILSDSATANNINEDSLTAFADFSNKTEKILEELYILKDKYQHISFSLKFNG
ncbi:MAG: hypothetical protein ACUVRG_05850 [Ignavibacterium sp.]|uniref:hypothetical protein n=1 Tax=Ignavibacterium sp. TaxID=2651167 RepID=UPI00404A15BC